MVLGLFKRKTSEVEMKRDVGSGLTLSKSTEFLERNLDKPFFESTFQETQKLDKPLEPRGKPLTEPYKERKKPHESKRGIREFRKPILPEPKPLEPEGRTKKFELSSTRRHPWSDEKTGTFRTKSELENLVKRIDDEANSIKQSVDNILANTDNLELTSPEMVDLLNLYGKAREKLQQYMNDVDRIESMGFGIEENLVAIYKFRACQGLAKIKEQIHEIERVSEEVGFTASKIKEILQSPADKLVEGFLKKVKHKKTKMKKQQ